MITAQTQLYGDPAWWLQKVLEKDGYFFPLQFRYFPPFLLQTPVVLAIKAGVRDFQILLFLYGLGTYLSFFILALAAYLFSGSLGERSYLIAASFVVFSTWLTGMPMGFEYNVFLNLVPIFFLAIVALPKSPLLSAFTFPLVAILLANSYEIGFVFGPIFLLGLARQLPSLRSSPVTAARWIAFAVGVGASVYLIVASYFGFKLATKNLPESFPAAVRSLSHLKYHVLLMLEAATILFIWLSIFSPALFRKYKIFLLWTVLVGVAGPAILLLPPLPEIGFANRAITFLICALLTLLFVWGWPRLEDAKGLPRRFLLTALIAVSVIHLGTNFRFALDWMSYQSQFKVALQRSSVPIASLDSAGLTRGIGLGRYSWSWMQETLSLFWSPNGQVSTIMRTAGDASETAFDIDNLNAIPKLERYGIRTEPYKMRIEAR